MNLDDPRQRAVFFDVHRDLPREGPGNAASTARALAQVATVLPLAGIRRVVDVACGPGQQTLGLARRLSGARILAVDLHRPFLEQVRARLRAAGLTARVTPVQADMRRLPVAERLDLLWCEAAIYLMGVPAALRSWHRLLRPGGCAAFSDAVWRRRQVPDAVTALWAEYPAMTDVAGVVAHIEQAGFAALEPFLLPAAAWLDDYYAPMSRRLDALAQRHAGDPLAVAVLEDCRREIEVFRAHGDCYGYAFFVAHKIGS